jgi:hypothetical protein
MEGDVASQQFNQSRAGFARLATSSDAPDLTTAGSRAVEAWFLGPKAENADELERLVVEAVRDQAFYRNAAMRDLVTFSARSS